ncbi:RmuC family protein [Mycoplasmopsis agalactiae]|uniref:DNA recombination protein RmuC n=1 Tax=Mycoplasmopsis agalactiae TaxID=2110 RepID=UPI000C7153A2|nr:DNA recombination protein RmuC [Mycoplasmopsis agalactiae]SBO45365.1 RmuC family protein [Mycoplasmopsis agalactiae]
MEAINIILLTLSIIIVLLLVSILALFIIKNKSLKNNVSSELSADDKFYINDKFSSIKDVLVDKINNFENKLIKDLTQNNEAFVNKLVQYEKNTAELINKKDSERAIQFNDLKGQLFEELNNKFVSQNNWLNDFEKKFNQTVSSNLKEINENNAKSFNDIKEKIDKHFEDTLTKHIKEQFGNIQVQMDKVGKEMIKFEQMQASVDDLNRTFSNNKKTGEFGEFTLEQILEEHYPNEKNRLWFKQYQINPGKNQEAVDFAMKIKSRSENEEVEQIIPIDCKFPKEKWDRYLDSKSASEKEAHLKELKKAIKEMAQSINEKYIKPDRKTTPFALMYVPSASVYLTLIQDMNFVTEIQDKLKVYIQGPQIIMVFIYSYLLQNNSFQVEKNIEKLKDIFLDVQKNYNTLYKRVIDGLDNLDKSRDKFVSVVNTANKITKKINTTAKSLGISKVDINENVEKKQAKLGLDSKSDYDEAEETII